MASSGIDIKITGDNGVERVFTNLPKSMARKVYRSSLRAGALVVRKRARAKLAAQTSSESTGVLERGLAVYSLKKFRGAFRAAVMVRRGLVNPQKIVNGAPVRVGLYGSVLEYRDGGQYAWLRPAARESTGAALAAIGVEMTKRLNSAVQDAKK